MLDAPALAFSCCARLAHVSSSLLFVRRKSENPLDDLAGMQSIAEERCNNALRSNGLKRLGSRRWLSAIIASFDVDVGGDARCEFMIKLAY